MANHLPPVRPPVREEALHGKRDEIAFRGQLLGEAKSRAEAIGREQRSAFADMVRMLEAWTADGISIDPAQITFANDVDQAAWKRYCLPQTLRNPLEPPMMDDEEAIWRALQ
jgi:hypothetical protein